MKVVLKRFKFDEKQVQGRAVLYDDTNNKILEFVTLERPWLDNRKNISCIPAGVYKVSPRWSPTHGKHFIVHDTYPRELILFHIGNNIGSKNPKTGTSDSDGCILAGSAFVDINRDGIVDISASKVKMKSLLKLAPNGFMLEILDIKDDNS
jgi:hypothetical protein